MSIPLFNFVLIPANRVRILSKSSFSIAFLGSLIFLGSILISETAFTLARDGESLTIFLATLARPQEAAIEACVVKPTPSLTFILSSSSHFSAMPSASLILFNSLTSGFERYAFAPSLSLALSIASIRPSLTLSRDFCKLPRISFPFNPMALIMGFLFFAISLNIVPTELLPIIA